MPISQSFKAHLFPLIPQIYEDFRPLLVGDVAVSDEQYALSPGFHIYDEAGIRETIAEMQRLFFSTNRGTNFFAVKACPNLHILRIILSMGFGLDCSSPTELYRAKLVGALPHQIMYTSNNTHPCHYPYVLDAGCTLNLDDLSFIDKVPYMPERICFRYNPGPRRQEGTSEIIGAPQEQKFGLRHDQIVEAYKRAIDKGATKFGLHTMYVSNSRDPKVLAGNAKMQLEVADEVQAALGISFEFINIGGGLGINYMPEQKPLDIGLMARLISEELETFHIRRGYVPKLHLESGRYVTGPHGALVGTVINVMDKYKKFVGVDFCDVADVLRAPMYPSYHEVSILDRKGVELNNHSSRKGSEIVSIVGPLCENMHMVSDRLLPVIETGDFVVVNDTGAHCASMSMKYNGWASSQQLLLTPGNSVVRISRAETIGDLLLLETVLDASAEKKIVQY